MQDLRQGAGTGLRERKKARVRWDIARSALSLFAERGYEGATVAEIAARAEVSERTFFHYFPCKEDVLIGLDPGDLDDLRSLVISQPSGVAPLQVVRVAVLQWLESRSDRPFRHHLNQLLVKAASVSPTVNGRQFHHNSILVDLVAKALGARAGRAEPNLDDSTAAAIVLRVLHMAMDRSALQMDERMLSALFLEGMSALHRFVAELDGGAT
jgi:AcrR family transcriptional regulator